MNATEIAGAISIVSTVVPQAVAAYSVLRLLWQSRNPGKTEAEFLAFLEAASDKNISEADAVLLLDGFTRAEDGTWAKS